MSISRKSTSAHRAIGNRSSGHLDLFERGVARKLDFSYSGPQGAAIARALVAGKKMRDGRIRASEEEIAKPLQGNWREEHLFSLKQVLNR